MKRFRQYAFFAGCLLLIIGQFGKVIDQSENTALWDFLAGAGAGSLFAASIWYFMERKQWIKTDGAKNWPPGSKKILLLVLGGLALVFLVFWLIFGPQL